MSVMDRDENIIVICLFLPDIQHDGCNVQYWPAIMTLESEVLSSSGYHFANMACADGIITPWKYIRRRISVQTYVCLLKFLNTVKMSKLESVQFWPRPSVQFNEKSHSQWGKLQNGSCHHFTQYDYTAHSVNISQKWNRIL